VGTRSPYGVCSSVFNSAYISGDRVRVRQWLWPATGEFLARQRHRSSGRVPAAFNHLVGLKPSRGWISTHGCFRMPHVGLRIDLCGDLCRRSAVFQVARGFDAADAYARVPEPGQGAAPWSVLGAASAFRFGVPTEATLQWFGDEAARDRFDAAVEALSALGGELVRFDFEPFRKAASLLYSGPWVAERLAALKSFLEEHLDAMEPTVGAIISGASRYSAVEAFERSTHWRTCATKQQRSGTMWTF